MAEFNFTDVLVTGAGPVGSLIALGLAQQGIDTFLIDKRDRKEQDTLGRASTLFPRSLELLEQLDLTEDMDQAGFIGRASSAFKDGKRVTTRGWQSLFPSMAYSFRDYILNIRQKNSVNIFTTKYREEFGKEVHHEWELVSYAVDTSKGDGYNLSATISHPSQGQRHIRSKYIVGADGGSSKVRTLSGIAMEGDETTYKWIRMDGKMKIDMPDANIGFAAIESPSHGNVLWVKLDRDAHRVGISLSPDMQAKYPDGMTEQDALREVLDSVKPFKLEVERIDWWTLYSIKQKVAAKFQHDDFTILAGDAAHTHSSGLAQGMNTGVHDATNLIWKLAGTLKGWYKPEVLETYTTERRAAAEKLIGIDKMAATSISGDIPPHLKHLGTDPNQVLLSVLQSNMSFTTGLGVSYGPSLLNQEISAAGVIPGSRSPDALLRVPGPYVPIRLHQVINKESKGRFSVLVFAGHYLLTGKRVAALRDSITADDSSFKTRSRALSFATLISGTVGSAWDAFDGPALGRLYYDTENQAHNRYGVACESGAIVVVRPDGVLGFAACLDELDLVEGYFDAIFAS